MVKIMVGPDPDTDMWHFNFNDSKFGFEITQDAFNGLLVQLLECNLYFKPTEMICDADDIENEDE